MRKIILIGNIGSNKAPSKVLNNLYKQMRQNYEVEIINTNSNNIAEKIKVLYKISKIIFTKNSIVNVHSFGYKIPYIIYVISRINNKNKYYLTLHGITSIENGIENDADFKKNRLEIKLIKKFPNIICVSNFQKDIICKIFKRDKNIYVAENGSDLKDTELNIKERTESCDFILAGGFSKIKNTLEVLKLINYLNNKKFNCKLKICGNIVDKEYYVECIKYIKENKLDKIIEYLGSINKEDLYKNYKLANYCISLSKFDTFNLTILEAMQNRNTPNCYYN